MLGAAISWNDNIRALIYHLVPQGHGFNGMVSRTVVRLSIIRPCHFLDGSRLELIVAFAKCSPPVATVSMRLFRIVDTTFLICVFICLCGKKDTRSVLLCILDWVVYLPGSPPSTYDHRAGICNGNVTQGMYAHANMSITEFRISQCLGDQINKFCELSVATLRSIHMFEVNLRLAKPRVILGSRRTVW